MCLLQCCAAALAQDSRRHVAPGDTALPRIDSLKAALVTAAIRPKIKGDTTEYNTAGIRLRAYANVEELLGRLPGLQIDADGTITYNGQMIQQLLVDGEDIFRGNPALITRNFDASKIAKVQVLDRKTDRAVFTGVDDGIRTKTLNLVLKETARNGYFGKTEAGANPAGNYNSRAILAGFKNKQQLVGLSLASNTGTLGYSSSAGGASGNVSLDGRLPDAMNASAGDGIPRFLGTALHYANSPDGPASHISGNYQYSNFFTKPQSGSQTLQVTPGYAYEQSEHSSSVNQQIQHWFYGSCSWSPAKTQTLQLTVSGSTAKARNQLSSVNSAAINGITVNSSKRSILDSISHQAFNSDLLWRTNLGNPQRNISLDATIAKVNLATDGWLRSYNAFFANTVAPHSQDTIDQRKRYTDQPLTVGANVNVTEPVARNTVLVASYGLTSVTNTAEQSTFARTNGKYQDLIDSLSNDFHTRLLTQRAGLQINGKLKRLDYLAGLEWLLYSYRQADAQQHTAMTQRYGNWSPMLILRFNPTSTTSLNLFYTGLYSPPSPSQLQPARNDNDPLHETIGNPNLRPSFTQNIKLEFSRFTSWTLNAAAILGISNNSISTKITTDSLGKQVSQPVNVGGSRTIQLNFSIYRKLLGIEAAVTASGFYSDMSSYINDQLSHNNSYTAKGGLSLTKRQADNYSIQLRTNLSYFYQTSSVNSAVRTAYWTQNHALTLKGYWWRNYEITSTTSYNWHQRTRAFPDDATTLFSDFSLTRHLLHNKLSIVSQVNNIFDQHTLIAWGSSYSSVAEQRFTTLGRYWLLSVIYHFDKKFRTTN